GAWSGSPPPGGVGRPPGFRPPIEARGARVGKPCQRADLSFRPYEPALQPPPCGRAASGGSRRSEHASRNRLGLVRGRAGSSSPTSAIAPRARKRRQGRRALGLKEGPLEALSPPRPAC